MSERSTVLHLIGRDCGRDESAFALTLAGALAKLGFDPVICCPGDSWAAQAAGARNLTVEPLALAGALNPLEWRRVAKLAQKTGAAVAHAHDRTSALIAARSSLPASCRRAFSLYRQLDKGGLPGKTDMLFAATRFIIQSLPEAAREGAVRVYAGPDLEAVNKAVAQRDAERAELREKFCPDKEKPLFVVYVAPFEAESRHQLLIEALPEILTKLPQTHLLLPGDGSLFPELERQARITALENDVTFLDPEEEPNGLLAAADVYASPRRDDDAGFALQIAMAAGRASVAWNSGAASELLDEGKLGALVPDGDDAAFGASLFELLHNRNQRDHLGRLAAARAAKSHNLALAAETAAQAYRASFG